MFPLIFSHENAVCNLSYFPVNHLHFLQQDEAVAEDQWRYRHWGNSVCSPACFWFWTWCLSPLWWLIFLQPLSSYSFIAFLLNKRVNVQLSFEVIIYPIEFLINIIKKPKEPTYPLGRVVADNFLENIILSYPF